MSVVIATGFRPAQTVEEMAKRLFYTVSKLANERDKHPVTISDRELVTRSKIPMSRLHPVQMLLKEQSKLSIRQGNNSGCYRFLTPQRAER